MKKLILIIALLIVPFSQADAGCGQTGGGRLTRGVITAAVVYSLLEKSDRMYQAEGREPQVFMVQKPQGYFGKVCNEQSQKEIFYQNYCLEDANSNGSWSCVSLCATHQEIAQQYAGSEGVYRVETKPNMICDGNKKGWNVCQYTKPTCDPGMAGD